LHFPRTNFYHLKILSRLFRAGFFFTLTFLLIPAVSFSQDSGQIPSEYGIKAVYLYNFLQFVHWPAERCSAHEKKVQEIAIIGNSPIVQSLQVLQTKLEQTQNTQITVKLLGPFREDMDIPACSLLFIAQSEINNIDKIITHFKGEPVLTVADNENCLNKGCMVALLSRMNKVRWAVNRESAEEAGLRLSSRLLAMAVKVIDKQP